MSQEQASPPDAALLAGLGDAAGAIERAPMPFAVLDAGLHFTYVNPAAARLLRARRSVLRGRPLADVLPDVEATGLVGRLNDALGGGRPERFEQDFPGLGVHAALTVVPTGDGLAVYFDDVSAQRQTETALRESEERLRLVLGATEAGVWDLDLRSGTAMFSPLIEAMLGLPRGSLPPAQAALAERLHPGDRGPLDAAAAQAFRERRPYTRRARFRHADGHWRWLLIHGETFADAEGRPVRSVGTMRDVTAEEVQREAAEAREETLVELTRLLEETQRLARLGSWSWDIATGAVEWSRETYRILGYDPGTVTPSFEHVVAVAHDPDHLAEFQRMTEAALAGDAPYDFVLPIRGADGGVRFIHTMGEVHRDAAGAPVRMVGTLHDVTETLEHQRALSESERRFRALAESSPFGIFFAGAEGAATYLNQRLASIFGLSVPEFLGGAWIDRIHPEDRDPVLRASQEAVSRTSPFRMEYRIVVGDAVRHLRVTTQPRMGSAGEFVGQVGVVEDVTADVDAARERADLEAQLRHSQQLESLGILAGGIAHDFNNLLVGILTNAGIALLDLPPHHPSRDVVQDIERAAQRAADLTRQLLAYAGKGRLLVESIDLTALVEEMVQLLRAAVSRRAEFDVACAPVMPRVRGDATQLRQIVMNLITNASDALDGGVGTIRIRTRVATLDTSRPVGRAFGEPLVHGARYAVLEVEDTGSGMAPDTLDRIFDPFFTTKFTGRGLGLAASLGIVRSHGGSIVVRTAPGRGTTFTLFFPALDAVPGRITPVARPTVELQGHGTVLVTDDDDAVRGVAVQLLRRRGFGVLVAGNGREALDLYRRDPARIRAVLLDLTMPVMSGEDTLRALRAEDPALPIVLMSGYSEHEVQDLVGAAGPTTFLQKPFRAPDLYAAVARALEESRR